MRNLGLSRSFLFIEGTFVRAIEMKYYISNVYFEMPFIHSLTVAGEHVSREAGRHADS